MTNVSFDEWFENEVNVHLNSVHIDCGIVIVAFIPSLFDVTSSKYAIEFFLIAYAGNFCASITEKMRKSKGQIRMAKQRQ